MIWHVPWEVMEPRMGQQNYKQQALEIHDAPIAFGNFSADTHNKVECLKIN